MSTSVRDASVPIRLNALSDNETIDIREKRQAYSLSFFVFPARSSRAVFTVWYVYRQKRIELMGHEHEELANAVLLPADPLRTLDDCDHGDRFFAVPAEIRETSLVESGIDNAAFALCGGNHLYNSRKPALRCGSPRNVCPIPFLSRSGQQRQSGDTAQQFDECPAVLSRGACCHQSFPRQKICLAENMRGGISIYGIQRHDRIHTIFLCFRQRRNRRCASQRNRRFGRGADGNCPPASRAEVGHILHRKSRLYGASGRKQGQRKWTHAMRNS